MSLSAQKVNKDFPVPLRNGRKIGIMKPTFTQNLRMKERKVWQRKRPKRLLPLTPVKK